MFCPFLKISPFFSFQISAFPPSLSPSFPRIPALLSFQTSVSLPTLDSAYCRTSFIQLNFFHQCCRVSHPRNANRRGWKIETVASADNYFTKWRLARKQTYRLALSLDTLAIMLMFVMTALQSFLIHHQLIWSINIPNCISFLLKRS